MLRAYQQRAIDQLYDWMSKNDGNPCLVLPTGAGKSHVIAELCREAVQEWPETKILMLTGQKELIEQNAAKLRACWPNAPMGIYSASIGKRQLGEPITFAGIQSIRDKAKRIGHTDLVIIDECFVSGTPVMTPSGEVPIDKVRCGDTILNQAGVGVVEAVSCKPTQETFRVELSNERVIECTGNHPFFTESGWKQARHLARGTRLFGIKDMSFLWDRVPSLDDSRCWEGDSMHVGTCMGEAAILLSEVCKEIIANSTFCSSSQEDKQSLEGNQAQAYKAWRKRAIAAFAAVGATACTRRRVGGGGFDQNKCRSSERSLPKCLQSRHWELGKDDSNRTGRSKPQYARTTGARSKKGCDAGQPWVVSVTRVKRESPVAVFNLQVSGHPSYFAGGVAVHNCHLVSHKDEGGYRTLINQLTEINPRLRVIGLTASPFRLGHGLITDKPAIFDALIEPTSIEELVHLGHLSVLRSKATRDKLDTSGVKKRGGDYIESQLQAAVNTDPINQGVVSEIIELAGDRKAWLVFCTGVDHAQAVCDCLASRGVAAACLTGKTNKTERATIIRDFKAGRLQALTNVSVLTTGFDYPDIDLIAMLRPTLSPSLYLQMAGRGLRPKSHTDHCLVLDFAGVVETHGPITAIQPPSKTGESGGEAPTKECPNCKEIVSIMCKSCPSCGEQLEVKEKEAPQFFLREDDIMGIHPQEMEVTDWQWRVHTSRTSGLDMPAVTYYGGMIEAVTEYFPINNGGYASEKAIRTIGSIAIKSGADQSKTELNEIVDSLNSAKAPAAIKYKKDGKFFRVLARQW